MRRLFSFVLAAALLFSGAVLPLDAKNDSEPDFPTLYIDNTAWYKYHLYPLVVKDEEFCIPASMLSGISGISYLYDENTDCLLITRDDGRFASVRMADGVCLSNDGVRTNTVSFFVEGECYISAALLSSLLGIETETAVYKDTDVLRICTEDALLPLKEVIESNIRASDSFAGGTSDPDYNTGSYKDAFTPIVFLETLGIDDVEQILSIADTLSATFTFAVSTEYVEGDYNAPLLTLIASKGHSFAFVQANSSALDAETQYKRFSERLLLIFHESSRLVLGVKNNLSGFSDCIFIDDAVSVDNITDVSSYNYQKNPHVLIYNGQSINLSKLAALITYAMEKDIAVTAVNPRIGN